MHRKPGPATGQKQRTDHILLPVQVREPRLQHRRLRTVGAPHRGKRGAKRQRLGTGGAGPAATQLPPGNRQERRLRPEAEGDP